MRRIIHGINVPGRLEERWKKALRIKRQKMKSKNTRSVNVSFSKSNLISCLEPFLQSTKVILPNEELSDLNVRGLESDIIPLKLIIKET